MSRPIYAIGDIHGYLDRLETALALIEAESGPEAQIVFLGDYVDRGPDCRAVMDRLIDGQAKGRDWVCLKGNHDRMFQWFMEDTPRHDPHLLVGYHWFHDRIGGVETMASYGVIFDNQIRLKEIHAMAREAVPQRHVTFLNSLSLSYETDALFFAHAGIRPGIALSDQSEEDLVWIRQCFHSYTEPHPKLIVHGHTPVKEAKHYGNRVNLDTGAGYGNDLTVAVFEDADCWLLTADGRRPLLP